MIISENHRGRNTSGGYTFRPLIQPEPNDFPGDSIYWRRRAQAAIDSLLEKEGGEAVECWFDITIEDADNWRSIYEKAERRLHDLSLAQEAEKS